MEEVAFKSMVKDKIIDDGETTDEAYGKNKFVSLPPTIHKINPKYIKNKDKLKRVKKK